MKMTEKQWVMETYPLSEASNGGKKRNTTSSPRDALTETHFPFFSYPQ